MMIRSFPSILIGSDPFELNDIDWSQWNPGEQNE